MRIKTEGGYGCWSCHVTWSKSDQKILKEADKKFYLDEQTFIEILLNSEVGMNLLNRNPSFERSNILNAIFSIIKNRNEKQTGAFKRTILKKKVKKNKT